MSISNNETSASINLTLSQIASKGAEQVKNNESNTSSKAAVAELMQVVQTMQATLGQVNAKKSPSSKVVPFNPPASSSNAAPTDAQMKEALGALMSLLTQLQCNIAVFSNKNEQINTSIGESLILDTQAQLNKATETLKSMLNDQGSANFWSIFSRVAEGVVGALVSAMAFVSGQPELAAISLTFTLLGATGGMAELTKGIAMALTPALEAFMPKTVAQNLAKVMADAIVIGIAIGVTGAVAGAGAATEGATEVGSVDETGYSGDDESDTINLEIEEDVPQNARSGFMKSVDGLLKNIPRNRLFALIAGLQAVAATNIGTDTLTLALTGMKNKSESKIIASIVGMLVALMASVAGGVAGYSVCTESGEFQLNNFYSSAKALSSIQLTKGLMIAQTIALLTQATGNIGSTVAETNLAIATYHQGMQQANITMLQSLTGMNVRLSSSETKALATKMRTWTKELAELNRAYNETGRAVAQELHA